MTLLSPGIETKETDISSTVGSTATGRAAIVGKFQWGPAFRVTQIASETELVNTFGDSDDYTFASFLSADNFLKYGNDLRVVRIVDEDSAKNASPLSGALDYEIAATAHSGYRVGNTITVTYNAAAVNANTLGTVTEIGTNGTITKIYIPSSEILAYAAANGITDYSAFTVAVSTESGGSGAVITISPITDSSIYFPNVEEAYASMNTTGTGEFLNLIDKLGFPALSAAYPGSMGDDITVFIINKADYDASITPALGKTANGNVTVTVYPTGDELTINVKSYFQFGPATNDQYAVLVQVGGVIAESFIVSTNASDKDYNNSSIFIDDVFEGEQSSYIYAASLNWATHSGAYVLSGGIDNNATIADWEYGWDKFADADTIYVNLLIAGAVADEDEETASTVQQYVIDLANSRADTLALCSPPKSVLLNKRTTTAVADLVAWRSGIDVNGATVDNNLNVSSSYAVIDGNYKYQYDKFSERNRWVPFSADIAGLCVYTDQVGYPWESPAGFNRGVIQGVVKTALDTTRANRDSLYEQGINPIVSFASVGTVLYGDKTAIQENSAFSRINVRRLFNMIKKAIGDASKYRLFELNDEFTRSSFKSEVDAYLDNIRALGGVYDFRVVCDTTNNTAQVIDNNQFVATIYIQPARSINFITLNFVSTSTGTDLTEL